ncbi:ABC transporter permease [Bacillus cereus]|uniref:ABC transporter permease n=1 Tax=Bacillus cereus TaxID=1396 RepID=UPI003D07560B
MLPYIKVISLTIKEEFQYRLHILIRIIISLIPLLSQVYLWITLYSNTANISGYGFNEMITYTVIAKLLYEIITPTVNWQIYSEIVNGEITKYFIRPVSFLRYWFTRNIGVKIVSLTVSSILILTVIIFKSIFLLPSISYFGLFIISCVLSLILFFFIYYVISLLAFWFTDVWAFFFMAGNLITFGSGALIPLNMLPDPLYTILNFMPFSKLIYFPINIFLERINFTEIIKGFGLQVIWIILFMLLANWLYRIGTKKYIAPGG